MVGSVGGSRRAGDRLPVAGPGVAERDAGRAPRAGRGDEARAHLRACPRRRVGCRARRCRRRCRGRCRARPTGPSGPGRRASASRPSSSRAHPRGWSRRRSSSGAPARATDGVASPTTSVPLPLGRVDADVGAGRADRGGHALDRGEVRLPVPAPGVHGLDVEPPGARRGGGHRAARTRPRCRSSSRRRRRRPRPRRRRSARPGSRSGTPDRVRSAVGHQSPRWPGFAGVDVDVRARTVARRR